MKKLISVSDVSRELEIYYLEDYLTEAKKMGATHFEFHPFDGLRFTKETKFSSEQQIIEHYIDGGDKSKLGKLMSDGWMVVNAIPLQRDGKTYQINYILER